ncbi:MAG: single-stranded DNA-binding protein [Saprospiraceae bacterium]|nr:single-stranded DNA-binding protein [Saprospiraceae bacterium]
MINRVTLVGHLGKDPEIRTLENGTKVGQFTVATSESYKDKNDTWQNLTEWHNVVVWRYLAEKAERELKKGGLVYIEGKITHRKYQDKDGQERTSTEIVASVVNSLERKENKQFAGASSFPSAEDDPFVKNAAGAQSNTPPEDDLPF